ncbi:hypothetical protein BVRB_7g166740 [Beta vulgaris subsp. vulgaris]|nr:hypothetical protein BVRB_7g166740 [Beta vulgaris subsp. vulgaris]
MKFAQGEATGVSCISMGVKLGSNIFCRYLYELRNYCQIFSGFSRGQESHPS